MNDSLPAGWYTDESGNRKYWTGSEWLMPTEQTPAEQETVTTADTTLGSAPTKPASQPNQYGDSASGKPRKRAAIIASALTAFLVLGGGGTWYVIDKNNKAEIARVAEAKAAAEEKAAEEAKQKAEQLAAAAAAEAEQVAAEEAAAVEVWAAVVAEGEKKLEQLGMDLAKDARKDGILTEEVLEVQCQAASGSSSIELGVSSTEYSCMAVTETQEDGQTRGFGIKGLIDWNTGQMQANWDL